MRDKKKNSSVQLPEQASEEMEILMTVCDGGMGGSGVGGMGAAYISGIYQLDSYPPPPLPCPWDACQEGLQVDMPQVLASSDVYPGCESDSSICMHSVYDSIQDNIIGMGVLRLFRSCTCINPL